MCTCAHAYMCLLMYEGGKESSSQYILRCAKIHDRVGLVPSFSSDLFCLGVGYSQMVRHSPPLVPPLSLHTARFREQAHKLPVETFGSPP